MSTYSLFRHHRNKRKCSSGDMNDSSLSTSPIQEEYENANNSSCHVVGNTSFISRVRMSPPVSKDKQITPLMAAARKGSVDEVKALLQASVDLNEQDSYGYTALFHAVYSHNVEIITLLLDANCNIRIQGLRGITIIIYCVLHGNEQCLTCLCKHIKSIDSTSEQSRNLLDLPDIEGLTPLMLACKAGAPALVKVLLEYGANPDLRSFNGECALSYALMFDSIGCIEELTKSGRFLDSRSKRHPYGALYLAAQMNEITIVHILCTKRLYLNQFIQEIAQSPSRSEETTVELALREEVVKMDPTLKSQLYFVCVQQAYNCLRILVEVAKGINLKRPVSLSGIAECSKWCIKLCKVFSNNQIISQLNPFWDCIEHMTQKQRDAFFNEKSKKECRTEAESREEIWSAVTRTNSDVSSVSSENSSTVSPTVEDKEIKKEKKELVCKPTSATRLLLSFIEIYVLAHYNLKVSSVEEQKEEAITRLKSIDCLHPRLIAYFSNNKDYLCVLVNSDPVVYDMLHFFKHSFNLFLHTLLFLYLIVLLNLCNGVVTSSITIHVDNVYGEKLKCHIEGSDYTQVSFFSHSDPNMSYEAAQSQLKAIGFVLSDQEFYLQYPLSKDGSNVYVFILAKSSPSNEYTFLNYHIPTEFLACNTIPLSIKVAVEPTQICAKVTIKYDGKGTIYLLGKKTVETAPTTFEVINEGVYLGIHNNEAVQTVYCDLTPNEEYTFFTTVQSGQCSRVVESTTFRTTKLTTNYMYDYEIMKLWNHRRPSNQQRVGVKYRRYSQMIVHPPFFDNLSLTVGKALNTSITVVQDKYNEIVGSSGIRNDDTDSMIPSIIWVTKSVVKNTFHGIILVKGRGDIYFYVSNANTKVTAIDVIKYGQNLGSYDEESVIIHVDNIESGKHSYHVSMMKDSKYYGPFSIVM